MILIKYKKRHTQAVLKKKKQKKIFIYFIKYKRLYLLY